jgi:hypothetical protein
MAEAVHVIRGELLHIDLIVGTNEHVNTNVYSNGFTGLCGKGDHVVHDAFVNGRKGTA